MPVTKYSLLVSKQLSIQMGYLHQFDYKINDETGRDFLQLGVYIELLEKIKNKPRQ